MDILDDIFSDLPAVKARRFQPKGKARLKKGPSKPALSIEEQPVLTNSSLTATKDIVGLSKTTADLPETNAPDVSSTENDREIPDFPDDQPVNDGSIHVVEPDSIPNCPQAGLDGNFSKNPATNQSQNVAFEKTGISGAINEKGDDFLSGTNDELDRDFESPAKARDNLASNREENDTEHLEEETSKKKRWGRLKLAASENDKPARKRKKASQEPDETTVKPPKKFPHATRRKRCVDKSLLEVPEDELDLHKVPMKDLMLWGEHKEREAKKQATSAPVSTNERINNLQWEDSPYHDDGLEFDKDKDFSDIPSTSGIRTDTGYYNYNTYRKPQPGAKWSKKDTELFYQGIRQFGTDLSMIQQLFPGRSLEQIRSKYRKEHKQNPMMIDDAQTSRAPDHTCFELVLETLKAAREAEQKEYASSEDDLGHPTEKESQPEENSETNAIPQEMAKSEQSLKDEAGDEEPHEPRVGSPAISDNDEDDIWNTYTGL